MFPDVPPPLPLLSVESEARAEWGTGERAGLGLQSLVLGGEFRLAPTLALRAQVLGLGCAGGGCAAGGGGELAARVYPFPGSRLQPYVAGSAGLAFFPGEPFLPGADVYEFVLGVGGGALVRVGERSSVSAGVRFSHLSNGQGLGAFNPALTPPAPVDPVWTAAETATGSTPGVALDIGVARAGESLLLPVRVLLSHALARPVLLVAELEGGSLDGVAYAEAGASLVLRGGSLLGGLHLGYRDYAGLGVIVAAAQPEWSLSPAFGLVAAGQYEHAGAFGESGRAGLGFRLHPLRPLSITAGGSTAWTGGTASDVEPWTTVTWALPIRSDAWQLAVHAGHEFSGVDSAGLRLSHGLGSTPRDAAVGVGWARLR